MQLCIASLFAGDRSSPRSNEPFQNTVAYIVRFFIASLFGIYAAYSFVFIYSNNAAISYVLYNIDDPQFSPGNFQWGDMPIREEKLERVLNGRARKVILKCIAFIAVSFMPLNPPLPRFRLNLRPLLNTITRKICGNYCTVARYNVQHI